jgi:thiol:disulfide interchange protein DsbC
MNNAPSAPQGVLQQSSQYGKDRMNRTAGRIASSLGLLLLALPVAFVTAEDDSAELQKVRSRVSGLFDEIEPEHVRSSPVDGWYTIRKGAIIAYISADGRYLLQGDLIDLDEEVNLSEQDRNEARLEMLAAIPEKDMIVFSPEVVRFSVTVFTDIDCTYCRRFHSQIDEYLAQGIKVRYLLYPRNGPATESWGKAEKVWCADDRSEALTLAKLDRKFETQSCDTSAVQKHYATGQDVGLRGTPAIVLQDGTLVSGYLPPLELTQALASVKP